jgi:hypothetical protein
MIVAFILSCGRCEVSHPGQEDPKLSRGFGRFMEDPNLEI